MTLVSFSLSLSLADRSGKIDGDAVKSVSMALDRWKARWGNRGWRPKTRLNLAANSE